MTPAQDIVVPRVDKVSRSVSSISTSPSLPFNSPNATFPALTRTTTKNLKPFATQDIKVLLLENVNTTGQDILHAQGYQVEALKTSLPEDQLVEKIK
jgi:D-3-phosphoglycerate dehydrogenase